LSSLRPLSAVHGDGAMPLARFRRWDEAADPRLDVVVFTLRRGLDENAGSRPSAQHRSEPPRLGTDAAFRHLARLREQANLGAVPSTYSLRRVTIESPAGLLG